MLFTRVVIIAAVVLIIISWQGDAAAQSLLQPDVPRAVIEDGLSAPRNSRPRGFPASAPSPRFFMRLLVTYP